MFITHDVSDCNFVCTMCNAGFDLQSEMFSIPKSNK